MGKVVDELIEAQVGFHFHGSARSGGYARRAATSYARKFEEACKRLPPNARFPLSMDEREWIATAEYTASFWCGTETYAPGETAYDYAPLERATAEQLEREGRDGEDGDLLYDRVWTTLPASRRCRWPSVAAPWSWTRSSGPRATPARNGGRSCSASRSFQCCQCSRFPSRTAAWKSPQLLHRLP